MAFVPPGLVIARIAPRRAMPLAELTAPLTAFPALPAAWIVLTPAGLLRALRAPRMIVPPMLLLRVPSGADLWASHGARAPGARGRP
jgi:hypothetical protein